MCIRDSDRTASPLARGRRSVSSASREHAAPARSRPPAKSRASSTHGHGPGPDGDAANGYSDSDGGHGSVTGSRKARSEQLASADISLDNIVEGGRRKRAKFESSELPLFVPPQVPMAASSSSLSPARRTPGQIGPARLAHPPQRAFPFSRPLPSPQSLGQADAGSGHATRPASSYSTPSAAQHGHHLRDRASASYPPAGQHGGGAAAGAAPGILPTPDPTVASCISDEDVAIQLMRLGDASNLSHGTRHSASTLDDGFSGAADAASSTGGSGESDSESDATDDQTLPARPTRPGRESSPVPRPGSAKRRHKHLDDILPSFDSTEPSSDETAPTAADRVDIKREGDGAPAAPRRAFVDELQRAVDADAPESKAAIGASASASARPRGQGPVKGGRVGKPRPLGPLGPHKARPKAGAPSAAKMPISPASLPAHSRKQSAASTINFEHQLAEDEEDLSSKPRCQRCRKSKKGCDRQRPCQRCKDAGIAADGCLSEDEGNGRKGRFGRHMGVVVKKDAREPGQAAEVGAAVAAAGAMLAAGSAGQEKSKKRKR
ncbi:MAG: hypothetical protein M1832_001234 [Thelocarpon impressellum]|nr:MAG: hypothetical protein M1832_001234 [Thelocarpon impressellum]